MLGSPVCRGLFQAPSKTHSSIAPIQGVVTPPEEWISIHSPRYSLSQRAVPILELCLHSTSGFPTSDLNMPASPVGLQRDLDRRFRPRLRLPTERQRCEYRRSLIPYAVVRSLSDGAEEQELTGGATDRTRELQTIVVEVVL